ncbi:hypothetical protein DOTSEDRAFT_155199 [Dothistroma septosporum NZE10]|uniref:Uncharacterized protein n=1 Tax=Dothistroma septosporum (strain NZE10 / CBS 128990) TaxID=675120 RepID=N1PJY3_DOTSN|nr:hypothetical protein DOTSEDRAFT_155199 [Dothistroma septosporum NZE10]
MEDKAKFVNFAVRLVEDLKHGNLLPNLPAHVHLLAIFRESGTRDAGIKFWQWLQGQDEEYVNTSTYAAAIDLLAVNGSPLSELEQLYQDALDRFPGNFHAYHFSPEAILADREQPIDIGLLPLWLILAITQARLLRGNAQKAYLALDTVFRLLPTSVPPRFFNAFGNERPVSEAFTVYAMACRAGIQLPTSHYKGLLAKLRLSSDMTSLQSHIASLRAMLAATYLHLGSNGTLPANSANEVVIATTQILRLPGISALDSKLRRCVVDTVLEAVRKMLEVFASYGALPAVSIFNSIITNIAGHGRAKETIGIALADMDALSLEPNEVTRRSIMAAAGLLGDADLVKKTWKDIVAIGANEKQHPDGLDINVLIRAARLAGIHEFAETEYVKFREQIHFKHYRGIDEAFQMPLDDMYPAREGVSPSVDEIRDSVQSLLADMAFIEEKTKARPVLQDFSQKDSPMILFKPVRRLDIPDRELRKIYDEMTTEKSSHPPSTLTGSESTGDMAAPSAGDTRSFGSLRYENWKTTNYLLQLSEKHDKDYAKAVDESIASGVRPPKRNMGITREEVEDMRSFGLSSVSVSTRKSFTQNVEEARNEIVRLRTAR